MRLAFPLGKRWWLRSCGPLPLSRHQNVSGTPVLVSFRVGLGCPDRLDVEALTMPKFVNPGARHHDVQLVTRVDCGHTTAASLPQGFQQSVPLCYKVRRLITFVMASATSGGRSFSHAMALPAFCFFIQARMSSTRQAVTRSDSLTGAGKSPDLTILQSVEDEKGNILGAFFEAFLPAGPTNCHWRA